VAFVADVVLDAEHHARERAGLASLHAGLHVCGLFASALVEEFQVSVQLALSIGRTEGVFNGGYYVAGTRQQGAFGKGLGGTHGGERRTTWRRPSCLRLCWRP